MSLQVAEPPTRVGHRPAELPAVRDPQAIARVIRRLYPRPVEVVDRHGDLRFHAVYTDDGVRVTDAHGDRMIEGRYVVGGWHRRTDGSPPPPAPEPGSFAHYLGIFLDDVARRLPRPSPGYARTGARQETDDTQVTPAEVPVPAEAPPPTEVPVPAEASTATEVPVSAEAPVPIDGDDQVVPDAHESHPDHDTPRVDGTDWDQAFSEAVRETLARDALVRAARRPTTPADSVSPAPPPATGPVDPPPAGPGIAFRRIPNGRVRFEHQPVSEVDPVTGHTHEPGEPIVVCARCDTAYEPDTVDGLRRETNRCVACGYSFRSRRPVRTTFTLTSGAPAAPTGSIATTTGDAATSRSTPATRGTRSQKKLLFRRIAEGTVDPLTGATPKAGEPTQRCASCGATYALASVRAIRLEGGDCIVCERRLRVTSALPGVSEPKLGRPVPDALAMGGPFG